MAIPCSFEDTVLCAAQAGVLRTLTFSKPLAGGAQKLVARLSSVRQKKVLAFEKTIDGRVSHFHLPAEKSDTLSELLSSYGQINLCTDLGDAMQLRSKKGTQTVKGVALLADALQKATPSETLLPYDRPMHRYVEASAPYLHRLGITDANGRIHDKKQAKYRQINRFLEHVEDIYGKLPEKGELLIYDLCCGKSYLSFAIYDYLTRAKGREVKMLCADLKKDVMDHCAALARDVGFDGMSFSATDIRLIPKDKHPHMVVSLHACDVATDIVLETAMELGAEVILSTPCCQRYMRDKIKSDELAFVTKHPHLRTKLNEVLTDALRVLKLNANGYKAEAVELTDPDDTPKNTLIRAFRQQNFTKDTKKAAEMQEQYAKTVAFLLGDTVKYAPEEVLP
ncbi:MAG: SAM-dependent methyltransferase [Clostridia bacterium]|nr:SAM-dependent methyltransferase [Clostridia bacterium]